MQRTREVCSSRKDTTPRERLFQLEIWRRQATGTVAEILGRRELKRDTGARLHRFRGDLKQELYFYHPHGERIVNAFVDGINAYIAETERNPKLLPLEFRLLGIKPGKWTPEVVISRHQGLLGNTSQELNYGRAVALLGPEAVKELSWFRPGEPALALDPRAGPRRRALRMGWISSHQGAAPHAEPSKRVYQDRQQLHGPRRLSLSRGAALYLGRRAEGRAHR
jgi:acyl-homoserine lactone acylase PvdQ